VLGDPIVRLVMRRDQLTDIDVRAVARCVRFRQTEEGAYLK
jgi:hypothetical protein